MSHEPRDFAGHQSGWISTCCGAPPWGEVHTEFCDEGKGIGICSRCKDHCECEREDAEDSAPPPETALDRYYRLSDERYQERKEEGR